VTGIAGLHSPTTAIVDYAEVTRRLAADAEQRGGAVRTGWEAAAVGQAGWEVVVRSTDGVEQAFDEVVLCGGVHADRLAGLAGDSPVPRIVPFRGEYFALRPDRWHLVTDLVYLVPDPRYPFLGVHLTPRVDGEVLVGPNAVLALAREGYRRRDVSRRTSGTFWPMPASAGSHVSTGAPASRRCGDR